MPRLLITGANGFVGQPLCSALLATGYDVRGVVRRADAVDSLPTGVEPHLIPTLDENTDWRSALIDVDAIVHLVARTHVLHDTSSDPLSDYRAVNVTATEHLLEAALEAKVKRFVFVSSIKAVGENSEVAYSETTTPKPEDAYGISKLEAERRIFDLSANSALEPVILRPPLIYGPGVKANFLRLLKALAKGVPLPLGAVKNSRSMVFVNNLSSAIIASLRHPHAAGEVFHVADAETLSTRDLLVRLGDLLGRPARLLPVPVPVLQLGGRVLKKQGEIERLVGTLQVSTEKIQTNLDWSAPQSVQEGLQETVNWFRSTHG